MAPTSDPTAGPIPAGDEDRSDHDQYPAQVPERLNNEEPRPPGCAAAADGAGRGSQPSSMRIRSACSRWMKPRSTQRSRSSRPLMSASWCTCMDTLWHRRGGLSEAELDTGPRPLGTRLRTEPRWPWR
jgi:hypothetical protein